MTKLIDSVQEDLLHRFAEGDVNDLEKEQVRLILKLFVNGTLDDVESERVLAILGNHDHCMDFLESIWMDQPIGQALASTTLPDLETSQRIQGGVVRQIRRSNAMGAAVRFGVTGFSSVASSLLKPLIKRNNWESGRASRRRRRKLND